MTADVRDLRDLRHPRYRFERWIASGGMGEVWLATDTLLDREVAVKVLRRELAEDAVLRARFAAEARHAGALQHPHVASVLDYGELNGTGSGPLPFLVMELVEGQSLSALLARGEPLEPRLAADYIAQAAEGIEAAHALGIVHRDVKPGNLLVTAEGQVKVTDFGVARAADTASLTTTGHIIGTPNYVSPEQAEGGSASTVSDVYSLGIVLFECLAGRKPFRGETPVATAVMQIRDPLPPFPPSVPERLARITRIATAKDPADRFRSAGALAAALRDESPDTRTYLLPDPAELSAVVDDRERRELVSLRRLLVGVVALLVASAGAWSVTASSDEPVGTPAAEASAGDQDGEGLVRVRPKDYLGLEPAAAVRKLEALGLRARVERQRQPNPGQEEPGSVAEVSPTGLLEPDTRVLLTLWSKVPPPPDPAVDGNDDNPDASGTGSRAGGPGERPAAAATGRNGSTGAGAGNGPGNADADGNSGAGGNAPGDSSAGGNGPAGGPGDDPGNGNGNGPGNPPEHSNAGGGPGGGNGNAYGHGNGRGGPGEGGKR